jgi:hypothetical protein
MIEILKYIKLNNHILKSMFCFPVLITSLRCLTYFMYIQGFKPLELLLCIKIEKWVSSLHKLEKNKQKFCLVMWWMNCIFPWVHSITFFHLFSAMCLIATSMPPTLFGSLLCIFFLSSDCRNGSSWYFQFQQLLVNPNLRFRLQICHRLLFFWKMACNSCCCLFDWKLNFIFILLWESS